MTTPQTKCSGRMGLRLLASSFSVAPPGGQKYLVLQGTDDQIAPPENGKLLKDELGSRVTVISFPGAGHLFVVTEHSKASGEVVSFLHSQRM